MTPERRAAETAYDLVAFGMKGSVAGISHYEVQRRGYLLGNVERYKSGWWAKPYRKPGSKFPTRREACEWLTMQSDEGL